MAIGCYTPKYLAGSFKGVGFKVEEAGSEHGRRGAEGEFPFGEQTGYADLGRRIRTYSISARFDGNDHILQATKLIAVCEARGSGILVHPTRGVILSAACRSLKVSDSVEEGQGVTKVDLDFVEANNWPNGLSLVGSLLGLVLSSIIGAARTSFLTNYTVATVQPFRKNLVLSSAQNQISNIRAEYELATTSKASDASRISILADLSSLVNDKGLAAVPATMDKGIALGLQAVATEVVGVDKFRTFRRLANLAATQSTFSAPASVTENAVYSAVRVISASYMAQGVLESTGQRTGDIFDQIDVINSLLDQEMSYARALCDNALFMALSEFKADMGAQLYNLAYNAPGIVTYRFSGGVHSVVAAYSIFGDAKRHRELELSNTVNAGGRLGASVQAERV